MASYNKVIFLGNVTRSPESKFLPSGTQVCEFGMACNRKYKTKAGEEREEVCFVDFSAFGKQAEIITKWVNKGSPLFVVGTLKQDNWVDKQTGQRRSKLKVNVDDFQLLSSRRDSGSPDDLPAIRDNPDAPHQDYPDAPSGDSGDGGIPF